MKEILHILLHSAKDTVKLFPFLFLIYFLIELLESKNIFKFEKSKLLKGKASPAVGALFGSVPQCGFSVISSELYASRKISIAALIAVFVATSDEAIPLMLADYKTIPALIVLILTKIVLAIVIGYLTMYLYKVFFKKSAIKTIALENTSETTSKAEDSHEHEDDHDEHHHDEHSHESDSHENHEEHEEHKEHKVHACCHHDIEDTKFDWKHPLVHCLKITLYIFIINVILGGLIELVGEDNLTNFLSSNHALQPILALVIGIVPNCASSVVLTKLYISGGLSFGAIVAGLSVNAGLGLMVLLKENKNKKENLFIVLMLLIPSLIFGYALHFLPLDFLRI
ncbi:MAG: arsenic efflux protein [Clostridia bacterium]|nr:arsenic efflux protein [Clostridia bacterium]